MGTVVSIKRPDLKFVCLHQDSSYSQRSPRQRNLYQNSFNFQILLGIHSQLPVGCEGLSKSGKDSHCTFLFSHGKWKTASLNTQNMKKSLT